MKKGDSSDLNQRIMPIVKISGLVIPVILASYAMLAYPVTDTPQSLLKIILLTGWIIVGTYHAVTRRQSKRELNLVLLSHHIFASVYVLLVTSFAMPFTPLWAVLMLASYLIMNNRGLALTTVTICATAIADTFMRSNIGETIVTNTVYVVAALVLGMVIIGTLKAEQIDRIAFAKSQERVALQHNQLMTLVNNLSDAVMSTDKSGKIQLFNAACLELLDTNENIEGKHLDEVIAISDANHKPFKFKEQLERVRSVTNRDDLHATISDERILLNTIFSPIRSIDSLGNAPSSQGYIVILRDITKQKSLEEERDEFISVVSHELRTPLTIAEGSLSNVQLMMGRPDIPKPLLEKNVAAAHEQMVFLARMVNDLSTLSRAERGVADDPELIDVKELIHGIYNEYLPQAEAKKLRFDLDLDPHTGFVNTSRLYLKELIQNFVTNAIKYTKDGGVLLAVHAEKNKIYFSVKDTGIGISKHDQARIFDKFYRSEDYRTRETGGTGLGLYVASKLARKLNTDIEIKSRLNHGSTFGFTIPAVKPTETGKP